MYLSPERSISEHLKFPKIENFFSFLKYLQIYLSLISIHFLILFICLSCVYPYSWFSLMTNSDVLHQPPWVKNDLDAEHFAADDGTIFCSGGWRKRQVH